MEKYFVARSFQFLVENIYRNKGTPVGVRPIGPKVKETVSYKHVPSKLSPKDATPALHEGQFYMGFPGLRLHRGEQKHRVDDGLKY